MYFWLSDRSAANSCHLDRSRGSEATECERRDPENAWATTLIQGVSTQTLSLTPHLRRQCTAHAVWGERLVSAWQRTHLRDFSTTPSVAFAPSVSARNDRIVIHH